MTYRAAFLSCCFVLLACSGKSNDPPPAPPGDSGPSDTGKPVDAGPDTAPPLCGAEPRATFSINMGVVDSTGPRLEKGIKVRSSLCAASDFAITDVAGKATLKIQSGVPQILRFEYKSTLPGIDGEMTIPGDLFLPGFMLLDTEVTGILPGYDATLGTMWIQTEVFDSDACADKSGVTLEVVGAPSAQITYFAGFKATKDAFTTADGRAFVTGVPLGKAIEVKGTKTGCNLTTAARGYTGKYTTEAGSMTYVTMWLVK